MTTIKTRADIALFIPLALLSIVFSGCTALQPQENACVLTEPIWIKPPEDAAVSGTPEHGYYYVNADRSIYASAWWYGQEENYLIAGETGIKVGWFRPAGVDLEITGRRIDADAPPLEAHAPCCYPTRFQAAGLVFPTEGCWEISAVAADRELVFIVSVAPAD